MHILTSCAVLYILNGSSMDVPTDRLYWYWLVLAVLAVLACAGGTGLYWLVLAVLAVLPEDIQLLLQKSCASAARKNGRFLACSV